jgi:hypothetical protein
MDDIRPFLIQAAREIAVESVKAYMHGRGVQATQIERAERVTVLNITPTDSECPYCEVALFMAGARVYLQRATSRPSFASVYRGLARHRLYEASKAARRLPSNLENLMIQREVRAIETALQDDSPILSIQQAVHGIDALSERVLDLAEKGDTAK